MRTYPSIRYPNEPETDGLLEPGADIVVMEKLDGANFRWHFDEDGRIVPGSRRVEYESADDENLDKNFIHAIEYNDFECEFDGDFKAEVRSKASKKCARVLKNMLQDI